MIKRRHVWAGQFYTSNPSLLREQVQDFIEQAKVEWDADRTLYGVVAPHAGYIYSGSVAGYSYKVLSHYKPELVVIISPSHREYFGFASIYQGDAYETPLGILEVDREAAARLSSFDSVDESFMGHGEEHALEVQLPFLQVIYPEGFKILPIVMGEQDDRRVSALATALADLAKERDFLVVASSDLSHFLSQSGAEKKDMHLISLLERYEVKETMKKSLTREVEACGMGPILSMMEYAEKCGNPLFKPLKYDTSASASGDFSRVVGYLSAAVFEESKS